MKLAVISDTDDTEAMEKTASEFQVYCNLCTNRLPGPGLWQRLRWWSDPRFLDLPLQVEGEHSSPFRKFRNFDLIWINGPLVAGIFGLWRWPRSMLDIDDLPSTYQLTEWRNGTRLMDRFRAGARAIALKRRETLLQERFTVLGVCSEADRRYLGGGSRIHVIPNGFEHPSVEPHRQPNKPPRLGFVGHFEYPPNLEGVRWFMRECWARIKRDVPDARLRLVGKYSDGPLKPADPDVDGLGFLADPSEEIATWSAMIVPIRVGGVPALRLPKRSVGSALWFQLDSALSAMMLPTARKSCLLTPRRHLPEHASM